MFDTSPQAERWLPIPDFPDYQVSDLGCVRCNGIPVRISYAGWKHKYRYVTLKNGKAGAFKSVARLVIVAFRGPPPDGQECCHDNGIHDDDRLDNLIWGTHSKNIRDQRRHGTWWRTGKQKLTPQDVETVRELSASGMKQVDIADRMGIRQPQVSRILNGKTWAYDPRPQ
jgi:hypothetical protein